MSEKVRRVDYFPDEYISGVGGVLRAEEQGVYWLVCSLIMSEGGAVEFNVRRLSGLCLLRPSHVTRIVEGLVARGKLSLNDGKLSQKRAQSEIERAAKRIESARENGGKGGRPSKKSKQNQQTSKPDGFGDVKPNYQPPTSNQDTSSLRSDVTPPPEPTPRSELETVLSPKMAEAVVEHRLALRKRLTAEGARRLAKQFARWPDPDEAAGEMIEAGWQGFKPEWMEGRRLPHSHAPPNGNGRTTHERTMQALDDIFDDPRRDDKTSPQSPLRSLPGPGENRH